tara:strand:+ start:584 stop:820 length:237 start_codon:yes stop_codon:yes gene_type:complete
MKTLTRPLAKLNTEISLNKPFQENRKRTYSFQYRKFQRKWKFLLITMSFFTFLVFSDSPEIEADICNKFNNEHACNVW